MRSGTEDFLAIPLGCLLSQLSLGFQLDQLHQVFNHHIALQYLAFFFGKLAVTLSLGGFVCALSDLRRGMESDNLFSSAMMGEKLGKFSHGLCFEQHSRCLLLQ